MLLGGGGQFVGELWRKKNERVMRIARGEGELAEQMLLKGLTCVMVMQGDKGGDGSDGGDARQVREGGGTEEG